MSTTLLDILKGVFALGALWALTMFFIYVVAPAGRRVAHWWTWR